MSMTKIIQGDCTELIHEVVRESHNPILVSDPPFNIGYHYKSYSDSMEEERYFEWLSDIFSVAPSVIVHYPESLYKLSYQMGLFPEKVCSWIYNSNTAKQHRDIAYFGVIPDMKKVRQPYKNPNDKRIQERIKSGSGGETL